MMSLSSQKLIRLKGFAVSPQGQALSPLSPPRGVLVGTLHKLLAHDVIVAAETLSSQALHSVVHHCLRPPRRGVLRMSCKKSSTSFAVSDKR
eukprot:680128-Amphidinium_carterae.1